MQRHTVARDLLMSILIWKLFTAHRSTLLSNHTTGKLPPCEGGWAQKHTQAVKEGRTEMAVARMKTDCTKWCTG